jgi:hypothetical protein
MPSDVSMPGTQRTEVQASAGTMGGTLETTSTLVSADNGKAYISSSPLELMSESTVAQSASADTFQDFQKQDEQTRTDALYPPTVKSKPVRMVLPLRQFPRRGTFVPIEQWEGVVLQVEDDAFVARLINKTHEHVPDEEGRFTFAQLSSPEDQGLVTPGSIFYFSVGYEESPSRQRHLSAFLRFRRLPAWTKTELDELQARADRLVALFGSHDDDTAAERPGG